MKAFASYQKDRVVFVAGVSLFEVHPNPSEALSDGFQALTFDGFNALMDQIQPYLKLANRSFNHG